VLEELIQAAAIDYLALIFQKIIISVKIAAQNVLKFTWRKKPTTTGQLL